MLTNSCRRLVAFSSRTLTLSNILSSGPSARALVDTEVNVTRKLNGHFNWPFWEGGGLTNVSPTQHMNAGPVYELACTRR